MSQGFSDLTKLYIIEILSINRQGNLFRVFERKKIEKETKFNLITGGRWFA